MLARLAKLVGRNPEPSEKKEKKKKKGRKQWPWGRHQRTPGTASSPSLLTEQQVNDKVDHFSILETPEMNEENECLAMCTNERPCDKRVSKASAQSQDLQHDMELEEPKFTARKVNQEDMEMKVTQEDVSELQYLCRMVSMGVKEALQQAKLAQSEMDEICEEQEKVTSQIEQMCALLYTVKQEMEEAQKQLTELQRGRDCSKNKNPISQD